MSRLFCMLCTQRCTGHSLVTPSVELAPAGLLGPEFLLSSVLQSQTDLLLMSGMYPTLSLLGPCHLPCYSLLVFLFLPSFPMTGVSGLSSHVTSFFFQMVIDHIGLSFIHLFRLHWVFVAACSLSSLWHTGLVISFHVRA